MFLNDTFLGYFTVYLRHLSKEHVQYVQTLKSTELLDKHFE